MMRTMAILFVMIASAGSATASDSLMMRPLMDQHFAVIGAPTVVTAAMPVAPVATPAPAAGCCGQPSLAPAAAPATFIEPAPTTTMYAPAAGAVTTAYYAPTTTYYAPTTSYYAPTTTYYAPAPAIVPATTYYAPVTTYYRAPVASPYYSGFVQPVYRRGFRQ
ncbi:MAG TPA: hypothetical protein VG713_12940 [Pirellulales bacterium]|nr:hypothetical protein [Pirellulales bacterium]